jgi:hypothetical protein
MSYEILIQQGFWMHLSKEAISNPLCFTTSPEEPKRLAIAEIESSIQGYSEGVFWERNTLNEQLRSIDKKRNPDNDKISEQQDLFLLVEP